MNRFPSHDVPSRRSIARRVQVLSQLRADGSYLVNARGYGEPAYHGGNGRYAPGESAIAYWNDTGGQWVLADKSSAGESPCAFDTPQHLNVYNPIDLAVSPDGQWLAWFDTYDFGVTYFLEIVDMTGAYISFQSLAAVPNSEQGGCCVFSPDGSYISVNEYGAPYVEVFPFDTSTGTVSAAVAAPAIPPIDSTCGTAWAPDMSFIFFSQQGTGSTPKPIVGYAWSAGFGARVADPTFPVWALGAAPNGLQGGVAMRPQGDFIMVSTTSSNEDKRVFGWPWTGSAYGALVTADLDAVGQQFPWRPQFNEAGTLIAFTTNGDSFSGGTYADGSADMWALPFDGAAFGALVGNGPPDGIPDSNFPQGSFQAEGCWLPGTNRFFMPNGNTWNDGRDEAIGVLWEMSPPFSNPCYYRISPLESFYAAPNLMVVAPISPDHVAISADFKSTSFGNPIAIYLVAHSGA